MSKDYEEFIEKNITKSNEVIEKDIHVSIDISMYPNQEDFIPPIKGFIKEINKYKDLKIITFPTSTVVQGDYDHAMDSIKQTIASCHKRFNNAVYIIKVIPDYKALD